MSRPIVFPAQAALNPTSLAGRHTDRRRQGAAVFSKRPFSIGLFAAILATCCAAPAWAVPASGQISIAGYGQAVGAAGMGGATGISFANAAGTSVTGTSGQLASFGGSSGAFAGLSCASGTSGCGTIKNISSFTSSPPISGFVTLVTGGPAISVDLTSVTNVTQSPDSQGGGVSITGTGTLHYSGFDDTPISLSLVSQGDNIVAFSATILPPAPPAAASVPTLSPWALALLGLAFVTAPLLAMRRKPGSHDRA